MCVSLILWLWLSTGCCMQCHAFASFHPNHQATSSATGLPFATPTWPVCSRLRDPQGSCRKTESNNSVWVVCLCFTSEANWCLKWCLMSVLGSHRWMLPNCQRLSAPRKGNIGHRQIFISWVMVTLTHSLWGFCEERTGQHTPKLRSRMHHITFVLSPPWFISFRLPSSGQVKALLFSSIL